MRLRNKKTGTIVDVLVNPTFTEYNRDGSVKNINTFNSLAELTKEWEDYAEPKEYWHIDDTGVIQIGQVLSSEINMRKAIGNYFSSREEAERAVEKLKAWKRLKDKGLRFNLNYSTGGATINHKDVIMCRIEAYFDDKWEEENMKTEEDLDLLLGGEE